MNNIITQCPCCGEKLHISALQCSGCGVEIKNEFEPSKFDTLGKEQRAFLFSFLKNRGNMKTVQHELGISYPTAKKKMDDLLESLDIAKTNDVDAQRSVDMSNLIADNRSVKASEIIKAKLIEHGGRIIVHTARGLPLQLYFHCIPYGLTCNFYHFLFWHVLRSQEAHQPQRQKLCIHMQA